MNEQRSSPRKKANAGIQIIDTATNKSIGHLVNISLTGFMLITDQSLPEGHLFQLEIALPESAAGIVTVSFGAESLWNQDVPSSKNHWVGFQIIDIADSDSALIEQLISEWRE